MEELPDDYDFKWSGKSARKYNWKMILDGKCRKFFKSVDFECKPETFQRMAHRAAMKRQLVIDTEIDREMEAVVIKRVVLKGESDGRS